MFQSLANRLVGGLFHQKSVENRDNDDCASSSQPPLLKTTSLFDLLAPDVMLIVFQYIGWNEKRSFIQLASCSNENLSKFIYKDCGALLWKELDLAQFPGVNDKQLLALLVKVNAQNIITTSLTLDKNPSHTVIKGTGLEPLRHSRVLKKVDLRQSESLEPGATGLKDEVVANILSTMLPHSLSIVKVRKQHTLQDGNHTLCNQYCFPWSVFFNSLKLSHAQKHAQQACCHCHKRPLAPQGEFAVLQVLESSCSKCEKCDKYTCRPWNPNNNNNDCPRLTECQVCLEWHCSCRDSITCAFCNTTKCSDCETSSMACPTCTVTSCSTCLCVKQCLSCQVIGCEICRGDLWTCTLCKGSYCGACRFVGGCHECGGDFCQECRDMMFCTDCEVGACVVCNETNIKNEKGFCVLGCNACGENSCNECMEEWNEIVRCTVCGQGYCKDGMCQALHCCKPVGELVYKVRDVQAGDDARNMCACGKKHLTNPNGQQFICSWRRRYKRQAKRARLRK